MTQFPKHLCRKVQLSLLFERTGPHLPIRLRSRELTPKLVPEPVLLACPSRFPIRGTWDSEVELLAHPEIAQFWVFCAF